MAEYPNPPPAARDIIERGKGDGVRLLKLGVSGWRDEFARLTQLLNPPPPIDKGFWGPVLGDQIELLRPPSPASLPSYPITEIIEREADGVHISALGLPAILVQLNAPDSLILKNFKACLKEARTRWPSVATKPGRKAFNARFDQRNFARWRNYKIIEVAELLAWQATLTEEDRERFSNAALGAWLEFDDKKISLAITLLYQVLADFRALHAQVIEEAGNDPPFEG